MIKALSILLFTMTTFLTASLDSAETIEARSYADIEKAFKDANGDTLGVFDIDDVLTYSPDPAFQKENWLQNQHYVKCLLKSLTPDQRWLFVNFSLIQGKSLPIDPNGWTLIKKIQENHVKTIALTASMPGLIGDTYMQEWRYKLLKDLGIDFSNTFPDDPSFCMNNLCCYMGRYPAFYKGILFANGEIRLAVGECNKGAVLVEFLRRITWKPKKVIFVDDSLENLKVVEYALSLFDPDIQFQGVHFKAAIQPQLICGEELQTRWNYVLSLVEAYQAKHPCCAIFSSNTLDQ